MKKGYLFYVYGGILILSLFVFFSVTSCSEAESFKNRIIGKWVEENDFEYHLEFLKDGTIVSYEGISPEVGDFKFKGGSRLAPPHAAFNYAPSRSHRLHHLQ